MSLEDKKVVIIGGSSGIGRATAKLVAGAGARVVITGRSEEHLQEVMGEIGRPVEHYVLDVRDVRGMDYCIEQLSPFDHLVITAMALRYEPFLEIDIDEARHVFDVNFWGQFAAVQQAAACLQEGGSITLFSGIASQRPMRGLSLVGAASGAIEALVRALALELSPLRVNAVSAGFIDTKGLPDEKREQIAATLPVQRVGMPVDAARAILFLMQNPYVTGTVLPVDGGKMIA